MRKVILFALLVAGWTTQAATTHVLFDIGAPYFNANPSTNRTVTLQAMSPFPGNLVSYTTDANGQFYFSNAAVADYDGVISRKGSAQEIKFQITVTSTNLGIVNAHDITSVRGAQTYPVSGRSAWSIAASDGRYAQIGEAAIPDASISTQKVDQVFFDWVEGQGGGTTYTNNTGLPGVVSGSSIGTNLSSLATAAQFATAVTNNQDSVSFGSISTTDGDLDIDVSGGTITAGANTMSAAGFITAGGRLNPTGFYGNGLGLTNIPSAGITGFVSNSIYATDTTFDLRSTGRAPQPVIVVADWSSDIGENHGLKQRLAQMDQGLIKIIAYVTSLTNEYSAANLAHTLAKYGHPEIPVGVSRTNYYTVVANVTNSVFRAVASGVPLMLYNSNYPSATDLIRNVLSKQPDSSVVMDWEGDLGPWYDLAQTTSDSYSTLNGSDLLAAKTFYHLMDAGDTNNYDFLTTFSASAATDTLTHAALDNSITGQPVQVVANGGTLPVGVSASTDYYLIIVTSTTSKLATTYSNAVNNVAINLTADSVGSPQLEDRLRDGPDGDFNLHVGGTSGFLPVNMPAIVNAVTNRFVWVWNKIPMYYPPTTTDPAQAMWVGNNITNTLIHPTDFPLYQDTTNYNSIYGTSTWKHPWDGVAALFIGALPSGYGTNWYDGTRMFNLSVAGKCSLSTVFPGHVFWTNNPTDAGVGTSNHFYITLAGGFQNQITNLVNSYIDAPPYRNAQDYRPATNFARLSGDSFTGTVTGKLGSVSSVAFGATGAGNNGIYFPGTTSGGLVAGGVEALRWFSDDFYQPSTGGHFWASAALGTSSDLGIVRASAGVLEINSSGSTVYRDVRGRSALMTNFIMVASSPAQWTGPTASGVSLVASNGYLYSIHNVGGTYTTNLVQAP